MVYPGCPTPPTSFGNIWYFDPVHGQTQAAMTTAGISMNPSVSPHQGDSAHPWNDIQSLFGIKVSGIPTPSTGYSSFMLSTVPETGYTVGPINAGDEIVLMSGTYNALGGGTFSVPGAQIINSPALTITAGSGQTPVLPKIALIGASGFVFNGLTVQSNMTSGDSAPLIDIEDGNNTGYTNTNFVFENMTVSSDTVANADSWTVAQWQANARTGIVVKANATSSAMSCVSVVNSHVFVTQQHNGGAIQLLAYDVLAQNNEIDHTTDGIQYNTSNVAVLKNYIHDLVDVANFPGDQHHAIQNSGLPGTFGSNFYISNNKIISTIDPSLPLALEASVNGIFTSNQDVTNVVVTDNLIAISGCWGVAPGNTHNGIIANNSVIDGGITSLEPGCLPAIGVGWAHGGTTGPTGTGSTNVRIVNNISPAFGYGGPGTWGIEADHNIGTGLTFVELGITNPANVYGYWTSINPSQFITDNPTTNTITSPSHPDNGVANLIDGYGQSHEFTTVPNAGSYPMSPAPNWTLLSGSPAKTVGGAVLIPPLLDYNGNPFLPPYSIGSLN